MQQKCRVCTASGVKKGSVTECCKMMFLTLPRQGTTPQLLKLELPMQTWGPKQKSKLKKKYLLSACRLQTLLLHFLMK
jgi:hypothetical protein